MFTLRALEERVGMTHYWENKGVVFIVFCGSGWGCHAYLMVEWLHGVFRNEQLGQSQEKILGEWQVSI